ncbi:hypothetical protein PR202_ga22561 [Eleusine coracana subsp. coracana]|uniref:Uncharacterized protein n=1 Tax=Eleusine coracana subsp. coracana TaxID=191504 RepID=A0AAV5D4H3_ELECO|nr:hypothetical protein PR202_ga22561 [Eleusine coracana subsp. coracana]
MERKAAIHGGSVRAGECGFSRSLKASRRCCRRRLAVGVDGEASMARSGSERQWGRGERERDRERVGGGGGEEMRPFGQGSKRQTNKQRKLHEDMDREQMKLAILKQEQTFRQQKQLMQQMQPAASSCGPAIINVKPKPKFEIIHRERPVNHQQFFSFSSSKVPAPAPAEDCSLELTLATGPSSSSSSGNAGRQQAKRIKSSSNSDSGTTAVSSTSTESELALFGEVDVTKTTVRFQSEARRMDEMGQGAWMYQCLSLKTA